MTVRRIVRFAGEFCVPAGDVPHLAHGLEDDRDPRSVGCALIQANIVANREAEIDVAGAEPRLVRRQPHESVLDVSKMAAFDLQHVIGLVGVHPARALAFASAPRNSFPSRPTSLHSDG